MKTKRICKSIVSLILAVMMLVSIFTVGIVSTSAAETDVATTGVNVQFTYGPKGSSSGWITESMTQVSGTTNKYECTIDVAAGSYSGQINYNNGSNQYGSDSAITDQATSGWYLREDYSTFDWNNVSGGTYKIVFEYIDSSNRKIYITKTTTGSAVADTSWDLRGSFNSWTQNANPADTTTGIVSIYLEPGYYTFKVYNSGWYGDAYDFTLGEAHYIGTSNSGDCTITIDTAGTYHFYLLTDNTLTITKVESSEDEYTVTADFTGFTDNSTTTTNTVTITPAPTFYKNNAVDTTSFTTYNYEIYVNGSKYGNTYTYPTTANVPVTFSSSGEYNIKVKVSATSPAEVSDESETKKITYTKPVTGEATFTVRFKSSDSYRYLPELYVNDATESLTYSYDVDDCFAHNDTMTQFYYWFEFEITTEASQPVTLTFKNQYKMDASIIFEVGEFENGSLFYLGVDNLNKGTEVEILPGGESDEDQMARNYVRSATNMVKYDSTALGSAVTSIDGKMFYMGDANQDESVNIIDVTLIQQALAQKVELTSTAAALSDYNLSGNMSISDATAVQIYLARGY